MDNYGFDLSSRFITADEFKLYTGIDLNVRLRDDDNPSNKVEAFLLRTAIRLEGYINFNYFKNVEEDFKRMTDYQKFHYKIALLEQALYCFRCGDIATDSGYDEEAGVKANSGYLDDISVSRETKKNLVICGLASRKMRW